MKPIIDLTKEYALALEGGGARGAYEIGAWRALDEAGVKITAVSGTSVGALNGAFVAMNDLELAYKLWDNLTYDQVVDVDSQLMSKLINYDFKDISFEEIRKGSKDILKSKGLDTAPLKKLLEEYVDVDKVFDSDREFFISTTSVDNLKEETVSTREIEKEKFIGYLIASSNLPVFKQEKINGKRYLDGGFVNKLPVDVLLKHGHKDIILVRLYGLGVEKKVKEPQGGQFVEIAPDIDLGSILEFDKSRTRINLQTGYYDGMRAIYGLKGRHYYIEDFISESLAATFFAQCGEVAYDVANKISRVPEISDSKYRYAMEAIYPRIAVKRKMGLGWTYKDLFYEMIECVFEYFEKDKYHIYEEFETREILKDMSKVISEVKDSRIKPDVYVLLKLACKYN